LKAKSSGKELIETFNQSSVMAWGLSRQAWPHLKKFNLSKILFKKPLSKVNGVNRWLLIRKNS
jgi:hypothetical protein